MTITGSGSTLQKLAPTHLGAWFSTISMPAESRIVTVGATPAHFGIPPGVERVDVRVTYVAGGRRATVVREGVLPSDYQGRWLIVWQGEG